MGSKTPMQFCFCIENFLFAITLRLVLGPTYYRVQGVWQGYRNVRLTTHVSPLLKLTLRRLMSYIYGAPILDVSRSHTTTQHSR